MKIISIYDDIPYDVYWLLLQFCVSCWKQNNVCSEKHNNVSFCCHRYCCIMSPGENRKTFPCEKFLQKFSESGWKQKHVSSGKQKYVSFPFNGRLTRWKQKNVSLWQVFAAIQWVPMKIEICFLWKTEICFLSIQRKTNKNSN